MKFLAQLIISAIAVIITSFILSPAVKIESVPTGILVAAVLALLNTFIKPLLVILTVPITFFTFGLFLLVINAGMILLTSELVRGFVVNGFWTALFFSIILSLITSLFNSLNKTQDDA